MIPSGKISYIKGNFSGRYRGDLMQNQLYDGVQKSYSVHIHPNSEVSDVQFIDDYTNTIKNTASVRLQHLDEVNLLFDQSKLTNAIDSKEKVYNVVITNFKISESGKDSHKTHGVISGTFYGTVDPTETISNAEIPTDDFPLNQNIDRENVSTNRKNVDTAFSSNKSSNWFFNLFGLGFGTWKLGGCFFRLLQIIGLLFLLSFLLRWCNSFHLPSPLPPTAVDSLSQDNKTTMLLEGNSTTITVNDWNKPDNDRITVKINDVVVAQNMPITIAPKTLEINNLHKGNNSLTIIPTNFGLGAVTATVEIGDIKNTFRFQCTIKRGEVVHKNLYVK